jgi:hypothetical protein
LLFKNDAFLLSWKILVVFAIAIVYLKQRT